ncbi:MAG: sigma-70 family RNA polymerase sigma factor [Pseudomonadota bacterium]|nr:sigma-70 family RNA polymerase sigma factor [Pseudomonadota bacterium]
MDGINLHENDLSDTGLMTAIATGDASAGNIFISRHLSYVMNICRYYLKNEAEAEEAAQDVFAAIWRKADQFAQRDAKVTTWLYSVTRNRCIDILRRQKPTQDIDGLEFADNSDNAEVLQQKSEQARLLRAAMESLSNDQRAAIDLVYYRETSQKAAADELGMTLAGFESVLRRARQKLHGQLRRLRHELEIV